MLRSFLGSLLRTNFLEHLACLRGVEEEREESEETIGQNLGNAVFNQLFSETKWSWAWTHRIPPNLRSDVLDLQRL